MARYCAVAAPLFLLVLSLSLSRSPVDAVGQYSRTVSYEGDIVVRCMNKWKSTIQLLSENSDQWHVGENSVDLRMSRRTFAEVQHFVPECSVVVQDLEAHVQAAEALMFPRRRAEEEAWAEEVLGNILKSKSSLADCEATIESWEKSRIQEAKTWFQEYHDYDAIVMWYKSTVQAHPKLMRYVETIGQSHEGRNMPAVHITASKDSGRPKIYFQCLIHAREWISGSTCMYIVNHLVTNYDKDSEIRGLLGKVEFIFVPFVNPDGYVHTWTASRLWRKNRQPHSATRCVGVDINRNFLQGWKASQKPCREDYGGAHAGSERETKNIMNYWKANGPIIGAIDWHSYSQLILHPWGYSQRSTNYNNFLSGVGKGMASAIKKIHGEHYTSEKSIELYQCYGIATDWFFSDDASSNNGGYRAASYVVELRDKGYSGFLLPPNKIIPTGQEIVPAVMYFAKRVLNTPIPFKHNAAL